MDWKNLKATSAFVVPTSTPGSLATGVHRHHRAGRRELKGVELEDDRDPDRQLGRQLQGQLAARQYTNFINPFLAQLTSNVTRFDGKGFTRAYPDITSRWQHLSPQDQRRLDLVPAWRRDLHRPWLGQKANIVQNDPFTRVNAPSASKENLSVRLYATNLFDNDWDTSSATSTRARRARSSPRCRRASASAAFGFPQVS